MISRINTTVFVQKSFTYNRFLVAMNIYVRTCACACGVRACVCIHVRACVRVCAYVCTRVCAYMCTRFLRACVRGCVCVCVCAYPYHTNCCYFQIPNLKFSTVLQFSLSFVADFTFIIKCKLLFSGELINI